MRRLIRFVKRHRIAVGVTIACVAIAAALYMPVALIHRVQSETRARNLATCESGNDYRQNDLATWRFILSLSPKPTDPIALARFNRFVEFIEKKDAPRDCVAFVGGKP